MAPSAPPAPPGGAVGEVLTPLLGVPRERDGSSVIRPRPRPGFLSTSDPEIAGNLSYPRVAELPTPRPQTGEAPVLVAYAGVNPAYRKCREGWAASSAASAVVVGHVDPLDERFAA